MNVRAAAAPRTSVRIFGLLELSGSGKGGGPGGARPRTNILPDPIGNEKA